MTPADQMLQDLHQVKLLASDYQISMESAYQLAISIGLVQK